MNHLKKILTLIASTSFCFLYSQVGPPPNPYCWPPPCVPIDGGLAFLVVAGIAYGVKKINDIHKTK